MTPSMAKHLINASTDFKMDRAMARSLVKASTVPNIRKNRTKGTEKA